MTAHKFVLTHHIELPRVLFRNTNVKHDGIENIDQVKNG